jgi:hypothetical protein
MMRRAMAVGCAFFLLLGCEEDGAVDTDTREVVETAATLTIDQDTGHYGEVAVGSRSVQAFLVSNVGDSASGTLATDLSGCVGNTKRFGLPSVGLRGLVRRS